MPSRGRAKFESTNFMVTTNINTEKYTASVRKSPGILQMYHAIMNSYEKYKFKCAIWDYLSLLLLPFIYHSLRFSFDENKMGCIKRIW